MNEAVTCAGCGEPIEGFPVSMLSPRERPVHLGCLDPAPADPEADKRYRAASKRARTRDKDGRPKGGDKGTMAA